jgi:DNA-binding CsgD family transcriptional regulator
MREFASHATTAHRPYPSEAELFFTRSALDRRPEAIMLVATGGDVTFANRACIALLVHKDGIRLRSSAGHARLAFADKEWQQRFDSLLESAEARAARIPTGIRVPRPSGKPDYVVQIAPLERLAGTEGRTAIFITDPCEHHRLDARLLETVYALTTAELRIAEGLLGDHSLSEIAKTLGIKNSTARSQLLSLFRKTRTSRQAQIVKLLMAMRLPG